MKVRGRNWSEAAQTVLDDAPCVRLTHPYSNKVSCPVGRLSDAICGSETIWPPEWRYYPAVIKMTGDINRDRQKVASGPLILRSRRQSCKSIGTH